jgi:hypothetical protein
MYTPVFRGTPTQRTEIRVAYDDQFFYAAGWFYDTEPSRIRVNSLYRDRWNGDDAFALYIDAFNDNRNAKWFGVTPAGMRFDELVSDDGATLNASWDTFWTARTTITKDGWFAEVRIPFSSIGFHTDAAGMQTERQGASPSENFGLLRIRRPVFNPYSTAGVMVTSYNGGGRTNLGLGTDGTFRVVGDHYLTLKYSATVDSRDSSSATLGSRGLFDFKWERRVSRGLQFNLDSTHMGRDYHPEVGFLQRSDYTTANIGGNYFIYTDHSKWLRRYSPGMIAFTTFRNADHALESAQYAVWVEWDTKPGGNGWIEPTLFHENVAEPVSIGKATIPAGAYDFADLQVVLTMGAGKKLRSGMHFRSAPYTTRRPTASTSTSAYATLSERGRTSGSSTTKGWMKGDCLLLTGITYCQWNTRGAPIARASRRCL